MPRRGRRWMLALLLVLPALVAACGGTAAEEAAQPPAVVEPVKGTDVVRVVLTPEAARRIGVRTVRVRSDGPGTRLTSIPYSAVLYDPNGATWAYTSPEPLVYVRRDITVQRIDGDSAVLSKGPTVGTRIVAVGSTELWGVEYGGIEED